MAGVDVATGQLFLVGEADGMDDEVQLAPFLLEACEDGVDACHVSHVAMASDQRADLGSKGVYYRAMVGPFGSREEAVQLCSSLKQAGGDCVVQH